MQDNTNLRVVLCWHMHQPYYYDRIKGEYQLPWTYLHIIKDYVDMAAIITEIPGARAVVNLAPTLLEQIDDYATQLKAFLSTHQPIKDPLLAALAAEHFPTDNDMRMRLVNACIRANEKYLINRYPPFRSLVNIARSLQHVEHAGDYVGDQYLADILTWYHIVWLGETVRRNNAVVHALIEKGAGFNHTDRLTLLRLISSLIGGVIEHYRHLNKTGQVELSVSPYAHPIAPLLLDLESTYEAMPDAPLPYITSYPGGRERLQWHIIEGNRVFENYFGFTPDGCWPAEGSVSEDAIREFSAAGYKWIASGEGVLRNSLHRSGMEGIGCIHRPYRLQGSEVYCFFRDDGLSDNIGFNYSDWHSDDAVNDLIHHLGNIANACSHEENRIVPIILDGENAWEHYPENGYHFLTRLHQGLADHPHIKLTTFSECIKEGIEPTHLPHVTAGSWVYGSFSTWIGEADKNRAWELLCEAKQAFDRVMAAGALSAEQRATAEQQLAICEGSDWFWWFGSYNPSDSVRDFDRLYRSQLTALYNLLGIEAPSSLQHTISVGGGYAEAGGVMRRGSN